MPGLPIQPDQKPELCGSQFVGDCVKPDPGAPKSVPNPLATALQLVLDTGAHAANNKAGWGVTILAVIMAIWPLLFPNVPPPSTEALTKDLADAKAAIASLETVRGDVADLRAQVAAAKEAAKVETPAKQPDAPAVVTPAKEQPKFELAK